MAKTFRPMPAVQGVAAGSIASLNAPIGLTYHGMLFTMGGTTFNLALITEIRVKGNGREIFKVAGSDLDVHNKYEGRAAASATQFYLDFERYGLDVFGGSTAAEALRGRELTAIGTGVQPTKDSPIELTTLQLELDISASASAPTLSAKALQSGPRSLGFLKKRRKFVYTPGGAVEFEISDLPKGDLIDKIYIHSAGNKITRVKLERDNFLSFDRTPDENNQSQIDGVRVPQGSLFVIDPSEAGRGDEAFITANVQDFRLKVTVSASDTLTIYVDYLGSLSGN
jgi:hypothetical protein